MTAHYEIVPAAGATQAGNLMTAKLRHKRPTPAQTQLVSFDVKDKGTRLEQASNDFRFSATVAGFGLLLRDSKHKGDASFALVKELARRALGKDERAIGASS